MRRVAEQQNRIELDRTDVDGNLDDCRRMTGSKYKTGKLSTQRKRDKKHLYL